MAGNSLAISVRINAANYHQCRGQREHDLRTGRVPNYVTKENIHLNSVIIENSKEGVLKSLCDQRRAGKQRAMKRTAAVGSRGIITFGKLAQNEMDMLSPSKQDEAFKAVAVAIAEYLKSDLLGLVVHRDESAIHAHFLLPAWRTDGQAISKVLTRQTSSHLQDVALAAIKPFAPRIQRGKKKADRLRDGDKPSDVINKSVKCLHEELPAEIEEFEKRRQRSMELLHQRQKELGQVTLDRIKIENDIYQMQQHLDELMKKIEVNEARVAKLTELEELSEKEQKRLEAYQRRAENARAEVKRLEDEMDLSRALLNWGQDTIDNLNAEVAELEASKAKLKQSVEFTEDGLENFKSALILQSEAMDAALALDPETPKIVEMKFAESVENKRFCPSDEQDGLVKRFIRFGFNRVVELFHKFKRSIAFQEQFKGYPQPIKQLENNYIALQDAVRETLTQLGIADQRPDIGEKDERGDPPPVLELIFSRAAQKARRLNQELMNALRMSGPSR